MSKKLFRFKNHLNKSYVVKEKNIHHRANAQGRCDNPANKKREIWIEKRLRPKRMLSVIIEEFVHSFWFYKGEFEVRKFSAILCKYLWARGYRLTK